MASIIITLLIAGIIAGLIQYFVDFKGLKLYEPAAATLQEIGTPGIIERIWSFISKYWEFFAYIIVGIGGAFLVPAINALTKGSLPGLDIIIKYADCLKVNSGNSGEASKCPFDPWYFLVLFGYGIILGYSAVRIIRGIGTLMLGNITTQDLKKKSDESELKIKELSLQVEELEAKIAKEDFQDQTIERTAQNICDDAVAIEEFNGMSIQARCNENPNPKPWKEWRPAESLKVLSKQVNLLAPQRSKVFDGMIGDTAHQSRDSDHNPWVWDEILEKGIVTALDITHDPNGKCNCDVLAKSLEANKDTRIKYVIWNKHIMNSSPINGNEAWTWRQYNGKNPHNKHIHISVKCDKNLCDLSSSWAIKVV